MSSPFFRVRNEKLEPRHSAIPVFLMLIWDVFFTLMSQAPRYSFIQFLYQFLEYKFEEC